MSEQHNLPKKYDPSASESKWYETWKKNGYFKAERNPEKTPFTIVIPPPNVTGKLHLGHAWDVTMQDLLIRFKRMQGYDALYLPGMDHAGIATQAKVDAKLREQGTNRYELGREKFLDVAWDWKEEYAEFIRKQWSKLGISVDYSRERFTLDEGLSDAVREVFVKLYEKGLIYRGEYIINWDPATKTALSDIEVIYKDIQGHLYHLRYPLADGSGSIEIATTRPETMLGDTGIAVHPEDERYKHLIGKKAILPIVGREIPIVADEYVDQEFGSGAVKITPAHDPNDFEMGNRHHLERILVMDESGTMNENAGKYQGLDRFDCRKQIVEDMKAEGVLVDIEDHFHSVGHSERSGAVVEPYLSTQWFVKMQPLADAVVQLQKGEDKVNFVPERLETTYLNWMENIRDWCISRQLWWGHRIPAWYHKETGEIFVGKEAPEDSENWEQDEDVLDTWFSSALWPFSTLGWPDTENEDFKHFFPTNVLITGYDIIFFWVARMIFQSVEFTGQKPFKDVLLHGLVRDADGVKMSKSLGNGIDPMDVIEKYGADALRYTLSTGTSAGQDLRFQWEKVEANWNFANKIWNASRFLLMNLDGFTVSDIDLTGEKTVADRWILSRLNTTIKAVTKHFDEYDFGEAGRKLYGFIWDDFCDWYIEMAKLALYGENEQAKKTTKSILVYVLDQTLRLLHPLMPFVTEEIWQYLPHEGETIMLATWPVADAKWTDQEAEREMTLLQSIIKNVRNLRAEKDVAPSKKIELIIKPQTAKEQAILEANLDVLERFCNPETLTIDVHATAPEQSIATIVTGAELYFPLAGLINIEEELERLRAELKKWESEVERVQKKLSNKGFVDKAPEAVVQAEKDKEKDYLEKRRVVKERIKELQS
ncbi:valyl-tRNA synthetase [Pullulanibacillus pueri]|uniref:Valine--tRNA ligase n=1 Tax=Pullulanibacillus pueri TaxID=1437324 RepID=A0A8J2ZZU9_9BACL|nr:valine--tRNA ligase [Pullulanibacillus pueri]MBM7681905.1 valyl-tRNA synthetase [Pullulanibacillus pueri]GGH89083.1 valine--tRNA ligase [Pullulanibacillus pueri]